MTATELERLVRLLPQPLVLVGGTGGIIVANHAAAALCDGFVTGRRLGDVLAEDEAVGRLGSWSRHGTPVPTRFAVRHAGRRVELQAKVARIDLPAGPAVLVQLQPDQRAPFAQLNDRLRQLQREVRYRLALERESAAALVAERAGRAQLERIQRLSAALAAALDRDDVIEAVLVHAPSAADVDHVVVALSEGDSLEVRSLDATAVAAGVPAGGLAAGSEHPLATAAATGRPRFYATRRALLDDLPGDDGGQECPYLAAALPLVSATPGTPLGTLGVVCEQDRCLDNDERASAELVARLCAQALERAQFYDRERRFAETLQWAMLPKALPDLPGCDLSVAYLPASEYSAVGGDWYDVIALSGDRIGLVVGDAAGHGPAAATAMGQMRNALRAFVTSIAEPGEALAAFSDYLCEQLPEEMATVAYVVLDPRNGTLRYTNAGHLPPLVIDDRGRSRFLRATLGPPAGVTPAQQFETAVLPLDGPVRIVCYSDGLIERRGESIDVGLERLLDAAAEAGTAATTLCADLLKQLVGQESIEDDAVVLVACTGVTAGRDGSR